MRSGILAAGNWVCDHVKLIDAWPEPDGLANILEQVTGNGGGPYNILKNLARLGATFPLTGLGLIGDDPDGRTILDDCRQHGIDATQVRMLPGSSTSFTDVMTVRATGHRTFFHHRGANARLAPGHFDFAQTHARIFYLGYLLLLDALDAPGPDGTPGARGVCRAARAAGLLTAVDCVSASRDAFRSSVTSVLPEVDVLFSNDFEAEQLSGVTVGRAKSLNLGAVEAAARGLIGLGVRRWAIVHFPEGVCACSVEGETVWQPAVRVPPALVAGSAGAGDALAAGVLLGLHEGWPMTHSLELGACAAAMSLLHPTCSESVRPAADCLAFGRQHGFGTLG